MATIVPLALLGRHLGLTRPQSVTVASIVMILPARSVMADYALSEQAITFFFAWAVLAAFSLWRTPTWWRMVGFVAAVGAAYVTHPRAIALVATSAVWLLAFAIRRWQVAAAGLGLLAAAYVAAGAFARHIGDRVLPDGFGKNRELSATLSNFDGRLFAQVVLNQAWVQVVGTAGLFAIGVIVIVVWTIRELRARQLGTGAFLFGLTLSTLLVSTIWWTRPDILFSVGYPRFDAWTYSRYIDHVSAIVLVVALAALIQGLRSSVIWIAAGVFIAGTIPVILLVAPHVPLWGAISPSNATILPWKGMFADGSFPFPLTPTLTNEAKFWLWASLFAVASLAVFVVLRKSAPAFGTVLLVLACTLAVLANPTQIRPYPEDVTAAIEEIESVALDGEQATIDFDLACRTEHSFHTAINWFPFWLSPRVVELVDRDVGEKFDTDLVISCIHWPEARAFGARAFAAEGDYGYRLWVLPGDLQRELDREGLLVPWAS